MTLNKDPTNLFKCLLKQKTVFTFQHEQFDIFEQMQAGAGGAKYTLEHMIYLFFAASLIDGC